ncbi:minor tail protein [Geobacillus phage GBK2]|uniref:minor tail protein n=1 Tax=Geobacillus phage GBK2 TaxID=1458842 RepID=UPI0003F211F3|nr:minor tail protein [Geobacillus phage GBK2]AHJ88618.1 glycoside hydrolase [Geobacillus phage GBK2]
MSLKFMTWTLHAPTSATFSQYKQLAPGEPWYSPNYIDVNPNAMENWDYRQRTFVEMVQKYHEKIYAIGMHEFGVAGDGTVFNMRYPEIMYPNGYYGPDTSKKVLNADESDIALPVPTSLRYFMFKYPGIRWSIQFLCTANMSGDRVTPVLNNTNGAQDTFIHQARRIAELYLLRGFPIRDIEIDFEKTFTVDGEWDLFKNLLVRVKNEVCITLGLGLRVNLYAMTGDYEPSYYAWHDYRTIASGIDMNGNQAVDEFQIMSYDFSWGGSAPGPSTPLWWLDRILKHVQNVLPPDKTFIGNAGYGRRWPLHNTDYGVTFDYKQLMLLQNGMYVHNDGETAPDGKFYFHDQDFIPFCGFNDPDSDYIITYPFVYDRFKAEYAELGTYNGKKSIERPGDYLTNYSKTQKPIFTGVQAVTGSPSQQTGNVTQMLTDDFNEGGINATFNFYAVNKKRYIYDENLKACVPETGNTGEDGQLIYNINLPSAGTYRLIAVVGFPFFGNDMFAINVNGTPYTIGQGIPEWYPFRTNPSWHFYDCGTWSMGTSNTITVGPTNNAWIGGFIVCSGYNPNLMGGHCIFNANLQKLKKRGPKNPDGTSQIVDAKFPSQMILTGELLRRQPRPAIIWEDMFGPHLNPEKGFDENTDLTNFAYYRKNAINTYSPGSGTTPYNTGSSTVCIDGFYNVGFSKGYWRVKAADANDDAHVWADLRTSDGQIVLNKKFACNAHIELDCRVNPTDINAKYGIRILENEGYTDAGYLARLNFQTKQVEFIDFTNSANNRYADMSEALKNSVGGRFVIKFQYLNGRIRVYVNDNKYLDFSFTLPPERAYGGYGNNCTLKIYRLTIATLDRFEPMEKLEVEVDGVKYPFGEVQRNVPYDEFGYLIFSGFPEDITQTEITPEAWNLDYRNLQIAQVPAWIGTKQVKIYMKDPGVWLRRFYIGDKEGYSVAYNSDKVGFIKTSQMVLNYGCKGIALWTLGQEDPTIFDYIPKVEN